MHPVEHFAWDPRAGSGTSLFGEVDVFPGGVTSVSCSRSGDGGQHARWHLCNSVDADHRAHGARRLAGEMSTSFRNVSHPGRYHSAADPNRAQPAARLGTDGRAAGCPRRSLLPQHRGHRVCGERERTRCQSGVAQIPCGHHRRRPLRRPLGWVHRPHSRPRPLDGRTRVAALPDRSRSCCGRGVVGHVPRQVRASDVQFQLGFRRIRLGQSSPRCRSSTLRAWCLSTRFCCSGRTSTSDSRPGSRTPGNARSSFATR